MSDDGADWLVPAVRSSQSQPKATTSALSESVPTTASASSGWSRPRSGGPRRMPETSSPKITGEPSRRANRLPASAAMRSSVTFITSGAERPPVPRLRRLLRQSHRMRYISAKCFTHPFFPTGRRAMIEPTERHSCSLPTEPWTCADVLRRPPKMRIRDIAAQAGITERAERRFIGELEAAGSLSHTRVGRRNRHKVDQRRKSDHPPERCLDVGAMCLDAVQPFHAGGPR